MNFGSVCSGIEAASVAWHVLGWRAAWLAEIEPFPSAVLAHHYPAVPNLGDMTTIVRRVLSGEIDAPDVFTGGTPCQAFSVAGLRQSLADARGNLSLTFCEIADAIDHVRAARGDQPCIVMWENVPGVLSTRDNAFGCFLGALAGSGCELFPAGVDPDDAKPPSWPDAGCVYGPARAVAWRVLDAQYFGVAQRRRRVFVVASARNGFDPAAVLFESEGVRRDTPPRREAGKVAPALPSRSAAGGGLGTDFDCDGGLVGAEVVGSLTARGGRNGGQANDDVDGGRLVAFGGNNTRGAIEVAASLLAQPGSGYKNDFDSETFVATAFDTTQITSAANVSNPKPGDPCHPLAAGAHAPAIAFHCDAQAGQEPEHLIAHSLRGEGFDASEDGTGRGTPLVPVAFSCKDYGADAGALAPTLRAMGHGSSHANGGGQVAVAQPMGVRRLTPRECERLQGFPDDYTAIPWRGKPAELCPDGPRYKALGNSWAVPCARWIGQRIAAVLA